MPSGKLALVSVLLAAAQALRLGHGWGSEDPEASRLGPGRGSKDPEVFSFFRNVDDIDKSNLSAAAADWMAEVSTARVGAHFKPSLNLLGEGWQMLVPLTLSSSAEVSLSRSADPDFTGCPSLPEGDIVHMLLLRNGHLCMAGKGFQTRAASTMAMIQEAASVLRERGTFPGPFGMKSICIRDNCPCTGTDFGYSTRERGESCTMRLLPDFTFWKWQEAGLLPNFTVLTQMIERIGQKPAEEEACGWIGNPGTHRMILPQFQQEAERFGRKLEIISARGYNRLSMENQTRKWACLVDMPAQGYSGRVPMLLHSGRPLLQVERLNAGSPSGYFVDRTWYEQGLKPWVHYIPVHADFHDLANATSVALSEEGLAIGKNALRLARSRLTTTAAVQAIADILLSIGGGSETLTFMRGEGRGAEAQEEAFWKPSELLEHYEDFNERFASAYQEHFASHECATYMIMAEAREILLVNNSLAHLADVQNRTQADMMTTIVALDAAVQELCQNYSLPMQGRIDCVNLTGWVADKFLGNASNRFGSGAYKFLTSMRPFLLYNALNASRFGILNMDADIIVRADLLGYVQNESTVGQHRIMTSDDAARHGQRTNRINAGLVFAMPTAVSIIKEWSDAMPRYCWGPMGDMRAINALRSNFTWVYQSVELIPDELVAGGGRDAVYAGHYDNCGRTIPEKIDVMKQNGEWWGSV